MFNTSTSSRSSLPCCLAHLFYAPPHTQSTTTPQSPGCFHISLPLSRLALTLSDPRAFRPSPTHAPPWKFGDAIPAHELTQIPPTTPTSAPPPFQRIDRFGSFSPTSSVPRLTPLRLSELLHSPPPIQFFPIPVFFLSQP